MTDNWNPTDNELRAIARWGVWGDGPVRTAANLARLVLREREELAAWRAECDKVGVPHDPPGLVRHHRGNAAVAAGCDALRLHILPAARRAEKAEAALARVEALCDEEDRVYVETYPHADRRYSGVTTARVRAALAGGGPVSPGPDTWEWLGMDR